MTLVYDSSQSAILSLGENTGQLSGNFRYGRWSYQTGSCRHSDLYRLRHWSPGRAVLVDDDRGHAELAEPARERDAGLAAADDQHVRLLGDAQLGRLALAVLQPGRRGRGSRRARRPSGGAGPAAPRSP